MELSPEQIDRLEKARAKTGRAIAVLAYREDELEKARKSSGDSVYQAATAFREAEAEVASRVKDEVKAHREIVAELSATNLVPKETAPEGG